MGLLGGKAVCLPLDHDNPEVISWGHFRIAHQTIFAEVHINKLLCVTMDYLPPQFDQNMDV